MEQLTSVASWRAFAREARDRGATVGLVPTMGALHEGHVSLMERAQRDCDVVIVTVFVNPRQFNDPEDLRRYPRPLSDDLARCAALGIDAVATPSTEEMWPAYPGTTATTISVSGLSDDFEGAGRPGHFDGVASVVAKLFTITGPCVAYFGEKDFQQLAVVRQMVTDLAFDVTVIGCSIVRESSGLALSSRNVRLSEAGRRAATGFSRALRLVNDGTSRDADAVRREARAVLDDAGIDVAYVDVVEPATLRRRRADEEGESRLLLAGFVDGVRLLDNGTVRVHAAKGATNVVGH